MTFLTEGRNLDIDLRKIRPEVEKIVQHGPGGEQVVMGPLPHTPRAKKVIDYSVEEARNLNHNYVGTEHLLLGLLREQEGVAAQVLMNLGPKLEDIREEVRRLLGRNLPHPPAGPSLTETEFHIGPGSRPEPLTDGDLGVLRERVRQLDKRKESLAAEQRFEEAAKCRAEADALRDCSRGTSGPAAGREPCPGRRPTSPSSRRG